MLKNYLMVFLSRWCPSLSCAAPSDGLGMGLPALPTYLVCVLGNMLPVPVHLLCSPASSHLGLPQTDHRPGLQVSASSRAKRGRQAGSQGRQRPRGGTAALRGDPAAGTGAWTGTLAASILDMKFKDVLIACMGGVLLAGIIMGLASGQRCVRAVCGRLTKRRCLSV